MTAVLVNEKITVKLDLNKNMAIYWRKITHFVFLCCRDTNIFISENLPHVNHLTDYNTGLRCLSFGNIVQKELEVTKTAASALCHPFFTPAGLRILGKQTSKTTRTEMSIRTLLITYVTAGWKPKDNIHML